MSQLTKITDVHAADKISSVTDEGAPWGVESDLPETGNTVLPVFTLKAFGVAGGGAPLGGGGDLPEVSVTETFNEDSGSEGLRQLVDELASKIQVSDTTVYFVKEVKARLGLKTRSSASNRRACLVVAGGGG